MKRLKPEELKEPGYYWWLPEYLQDQPEDPLHWTIVHWHPKDDRVQKVGVFYGPLNPPTITDIA